MPPVVPTRQMPGHCKPSPPTDSHPGCLRPSVLDRNGREALGKPRQRSARFDTNVSVGVGNCWRSISAGRADTSSPGTINCLHRGKDHRPDRPLEVAAAIDRPKAIRPDGPVCGVDHCPGRLHQRFQGRQSKSPISIGIGPDFRAIGVSNRPGNLIEHGIGGGLLGHHNSSHEGCSKCPNW
jgi:hypothetical protein